MPSLEISDSDDEAVALFSREHVRFVQRYANIGISETAAIIIPHEDEDHSDDEDALDYENDSEAMQKIEDEVDEHFDIKRELSPDFPEPQVLIARGEPVRRRAVHGPRLISRNRPVPQREQRNSYNKDGMVLRPGDMVEIVEVKQAHRCQFLIIKLIFKCSGNTFFRGIPYTRTRNTAGMIDPKRNELVEVLDVDLDDERPEEHQGAIEVVAGDIICKRSFQFTNTYWPEFGCDIRNFSGSADLVEEQGKLTIRWRMVTYFTTASKRLQATPKPVGRSLLALAAHEIPDPDKRVSSHTQLNAWRGTKVRGGSHNPRSKDSGVVDVENVEVRDSPIALTEDQTYTFADIFSGCGGASRGAKNAGFHVKLACDLDAKACQSYRANFPEADLHERDISDLILQVQNHENRIDVLHLSPPCQYYSPAHTTAGKDDDKNMAILLSAHAVIYKFRPRIVTVEQTFGILREQHKYMFHYFLNCFTMHGYSVTWQHVWLNTWGVPQPRQRVIFIASCPGEAHPKMPDTRIYTSVNKALRSIKRRATLHDVNSELGRPNFPKPAWNGEGLLKETILTNTNRSYIYHPSGLRPFTLREIAALQTFPSNHRFEGNRVDVSRQIGNAFPCAAVEHLYRHLMAHLREEDQVVADLDDEEDNDDDDDLMVVEGEDPL
ncbi:hypothetical protein JX266_010112 [Neoarthrinium moseri]|nr:hypothetical protein JX266_010112 [Neoarthrinium moseri]